MVPTDTSLIPQWRNPGFNDAAWTAGTFGVGYNNNGNVADLGVNFGASSPTPMSGTGRHSYTRVRFNVADKSALAGLKLRVNYDDGFVAWINGTLAANSSGAPTTDPISPTALVANHGAGTFEEFTPTTGAFAAVVTGENVLAIEGMNTTNGSSDAFVSVQLIGTLAAGSGVTGYFTVATPGTPNGGVDTIRLPAEVTFSRPSGPFTTAFSLTLGGASAGQEIRYVISDPSGSGATLAEPTAASTLYTGPIAISSSKLVRAAIYQGTQRSRTYTAQYLLLETGTSNNTSNFTSILPIAILDDHGAGQPVDSSSNTYTPAMLHVIEPTAGTAALNSAPTVSTRAGARVRGSSSAGFAKKSYGLETWGQQNDDEDTPLLGMPADSDWVLNGPFLFDDTYIHNAYIYEVSRRIERWAPRTRPVELFMNQNGGKLDYTDYAGVYIVTEKIKSSSDRVPIAGINPEDNTGSALTGGYIFKIDRADGGEYAWTINNSSFGLGTLPNQESGQSLVLVEPDPDFDTTQQQNYIRNDAIQPFNNTLFTERAAGFTTRNYRNYIDTASFVDHHILNALAYNVDALRLSAFYFKDRNRRINAGPIWDFDRALGSDDGRDANPSSWNNMTYFFDRDWWGGLFKDPQFVQEWVDRWWQLRQTGKPFSNANLLALADQMGAEIGNVAGARDAAKWSENAASGGVYLNEINAMKNWMTSRLAFIDNACPGPPTTSVLSGPVAAGSTVSLSGSGILRYTRDGTDPRPFGGATPGTNFTYTGPLTVNATTVLTARRQSTFTPFPSGAVSISWSAPLVRVLLVNEVFAEAADLAVSEINYNPLAPTAAELAAAPGTTADDYEWIELTNVGTRTVNTFELSFPIGLPFERTLVLAPLTLAPGQTALVVKNSTAFAARYGVGAAARIVAEWGDGALDNGGPAVQLLARNGAPIADFRVRDGGSWPGRADGRGATLEFTATAHTTVEYEDSASWRSSSEIHGTPGSAGSGPDGRIVINEVLSASTLPLVDAIELKNVSATPVDLSGWWLSDVGSPETALDYQKFAIPAGTILPAGGYIVFTEADFNPNGAWNPLGGAPGPNEFALDGTRGEDVWLFSPLGTTLRLADHVDFGTARTGESFGRWPDGTGPLIPLASRTLFAESSPVSPRPGQGTANSAARTGPVIIQEIHHAPPGGNTDLEFVELFNPTASAVTLTLWQLRGEVDFDFAPGTTIPAGGVLVVVPFAPSNTTLADSFRTAYGIDSSVALAGPWQSGDHLGTNGEIRLLRGETPPVDDPGFFPETVEDEVNYRGSDPAWPVTTGGPSLNRALRSLGNEPASWFADFPTPGDSHLRFAYWQSLYFADGAPNSGANADAEGDSLSNAVEFALGRNPTVPDADPAALPSVEIASAGNDTTLTLTYTRPQRVPGVTYTVETSDDLATWTPVADESVSSTATTETRRASITSPDSPRFLRLTVTVTP